MNGDLKEIYLYEPIDYEIITKRLDTGHPDLETFW